VVLTIRLCLNKNVYELVTLGRGYLLSDLRNCTFHKAYLLKSVVNFCWWFHDLWREIAKNVQMGDPDIVSFLMRASIYMGIYSTQSQVKTADRRIQLTGANHSVRKSPPLGLTLSNWSSLNRSRHRLSQAVRYSKEPRPNHVKPTGYWAGASSVFVTLLTHEALQHE
jgi:hypothetical protein